MSWHVHSNSSGVWDSDGYGCNTDSPVSAAEYIDDNLKTKDEIAIADAILEFIQDKAEEYFNTKDWDDAEWDAWHDKIRELM